METLLWVWKQNKSVIDKDMKVDRKYPIMLERISFSAKMLYYKVMIPVINWFFFLEFWPDSSKVRLLWKKDHCINSGIPAGRLSGSHNRSDGIHRIWHLRKGKWTSQFWHVKKRCSYRGNHRSRHACRWEYSGWNPCIRWNNIVYHVLLFWWTWYSQCIWGKEEGRRQCQYDSMVIWWWIQGSSFVLRNYRWSEIMYAWQGSVVSLFFVWQAVKLKWS